MNITVFNESGHLLEIIADAFLDAGAYSHIFDATSYPYSTLYYLSVHYQGHDEANQTYTIYRD